MRPPRFPIVWVMVFVALAALEFGAIRTVTDYRGATGDSLVVSASRWLTSWWSAS